MLESIEKLRELLECCGCSDECYSCRISYEGRKVIDEIEREIAEKYMQLPVDADGVPICVGDELETAHGGKVIVKYVGECEIRCYRDGGLYRVSQDEYAYTCRHVKPRTVEDVLEELLDEPDWEQSPDTYEDIKRRMIARYADELRELLGSDAE